MGRIIYSQVQHSVCVWLMCVRLYTENKHKFSVKLKKAATETIEILQAYSNEVMSQVRCFEWHLRGAEVWVIWWSWCTMSSITWAFSRVVFVKLFKGLHIQFLWLCTFWSLLVHIIWWKTWIIKLCIRSLLLAAHGSNMKGIQGALSNVASECALDEKIIQLTLYISNPSAFTWLTV